MASGSCLEVLPWLPPWWGDLRVAGWTNPLLPKALSRVLFPNQDCSETPIPLCSGWRWELAVSWLPPHPQLRFLSPHGEQLTNRATVLPVQSTYTAQPSPYTTFFFFRGKILYFGKVWCVRFGRGWRGPPSLLSSAGQIFKVFLSQESPTHVYLQFSSTTPLIGIWSFLIILQGWLWIHFHFI